MKKLICSVIAVIMLMAMCVTPASAAGAGETMGKVTVNRAYSDGYTTVTMDVPQNFTVRYTLDGTKPTKTSKLYKGETIKVCDDTKLRTKVTLPDGKTERHSYNVKVKYKTLAALEKSGKLDNLSPAEDFTSRYSYQLLNDAQKAWCRELYVYNKYRIKYETPALTDDEHTDVCNVFWSANPFISINDHGKENQKIIKNMTEEIVEDALKQGNDYDILQYIHDSIIDLFDYSSGQSFWTDGMLDREANCVGYSDAFTYMCEMAGYDCMTVIGFAVKTDGTQEGHAWNAVCVNDKWYYVDVTWDDDRLLVDSHNYFLKGTKDELFASTHVLEIYEPRDIYPLISDTNYKK